ncbi:MAG TPA: PAS domain-containing protein [Bacilli bacterium]
MSELIKTEKLKKEALSELVKKLLSGESVKDFFLENETIIKNITPFDVFSIPYFQEEHGQEIEKIKAIAGKLLNLIHHSLEEYPWKKEETSLLMKYLLQEGEAIRAKFSEFKAYVKEMGKIEKSDIIGFLQDFKELEKRFLKMQNLIFPALEKKMVNPKPLQIMWSLHDDAKDMLLTLKEKFAKNSPDLKQGIGKYFFLVLGIIEKEELLVLPIASRLLDEEEWKTLLKEASQIGFSFINVNLKTFEEETDVKSDFTGLLFNSETGGLTLQELLAVLNRLPLNMTFVGENNKVKYFNASPNRIFPRTPSVIGREVSKCHPPKSVHVVEKIIDAFRKGTKNEAKFWLEIHGRFLVITYYAIRNKQGEYKGVLEVTQDATEIRNLTGEQKLLDWEE